MSSAGAGEAARHLSPTAPQPADPLHAHSFSRRDRPSTASTALGGDRTTRGLCLPVGGRGRAGSPAGWGSGASEKRALDKSCQERGGSAGSWGAASTPAGGLGGRAALRRAAQHRGSRAGTHLRGRPDLLVQAVAVEGVWGPSKHCKARGQQGWGTPGSPGRGRTGQGLSCSRCWASGATLGSAPQPGWVLQHRARPGPSSPRPPPITCCLPDEADVALQLLDELGGALGAGVQQDLQHLWAVGGLTVRKPPARGDGPEHGHCLGAPLRPGQPRHRQSRPPLAVTHPPSA